MKSRGLFPGPSSRPKRSGYGGSAGNSEYTHVLPNTDGYKDGALGWKAGRSAGGTSGNNRQVPMPFKNRGQSGEGGLAYDASCAEYMTEKAKPKCGPLNQNAESPLVASGSSLARLVPRRLVPHQPDPFPPLLGHQTRPLGHCQR